MPKYYKRLFITMGLCVVVLIVFLYALPGHRVTFYVSMGLVIILSVLRAGFSWPETRRALPWLARGRSGDEQAEDVSLTDRFLAFTDVII